MKIKNIAMYALLTGGLSLPVMTSGIALSHAADGTVKGGHLVTFKHDTPAGAWKATQVSAEKSKHPYCSVEANFKNAGATLVLARSKKGLNSLAIDFGQELFEKGRQYDIRIGTDIGLERKFTARALTPTLLMAQVGRDKPLMRAISYNGDFVFHVPQKVRATLTLAGADDALERLGRCLMTLEDFVPPLADDTYLREARAKAVKKRRSGDNTLVEERGPSRTAKTRVASRTAPENVPVPPRKADMMNIKVTRVDAPVVYEPKVSDDDTIAQMDMVEIARKEISSKIDELAQQGDVKAGEAEERVTYSEKHVTPARKEKAAPEPEAVAEAAPETTEDKPVENKLAKAETPQVSEDMQAEPEADTAQEDVAEKTVTEQAVAVKKAADGHEIVADVSSPVDNTAEPMDAVNVDTAMATPPSDDGLMSPMPGQNTENPVQVAHNTVKDEDIVIAVTQPQDQAQDMNSANMAAKPIVWSSDRAEIRDPAAKNIMALEKRTKKVAAEQPVKTTAATSSLLPAPDLPSDLPEEGAYFPEQMAELPPAEIKNAIKVEVAEPVTPAEGNVQSETTMQVASLQAVSGPFDPAEYARLTKLAQSKHARELEMTEKAEANAAQNDPAALEPISLVAQDEDDVADIITAAGGDMDDTGSTAAMAPTPASLSTAAPSKATGAPTSLSFKTTGSLSQEAYMALKTDNAPVTMAPAAVKKTTLSEAVSQMIPAEYQITVGNGVDMTQKVSWHKGDNWQDMIAETLGPIGIEAKVKGRVVMLMTMAQ